MVVPTLKVIESKLKPGAVLLADNVYSSITGYAVRRRFIQFDSTALLYPRSPVAEICTDISTVLL
jgi:hypothetical protein